MAIIGFNVGSTLSVKDMSLVVDYLIDKKSFEPELQDIQIKIIGKENTTEGTLNSREASGYVKTNPC